MNEPELSLEEIKALRLCKCGGYKHGHWEQCSRCFLLFSNNGKHQEFIEALKRVKNGEIEYETLFQYLDCDLPSRKSTMIGILLQNRILISREDYALFKKGYDRLELKKRQTVTGKERGKIEAILNKGTKVYRGFNTAP